MSRFNSQSYQHLHATALDNTAAPYSSPYGHQQADPSRTPYRNWKILAVISRTLLLLGILAVPPLFDKDQDALRASKTLLTVLALIAVTTGVSLSPLLCYAVQDSSFRLYSVLLPSLGHAFIGLLALIYYTAVYTSAEFPATPSVLSIILCAAAIVVYGAASLYTYRRLLRGPRRHTFTASTNTASNSFRKPRHDSETVSGHAYRPSNASSTGLSLLASPPLNGPSANPFASSNHLPYDTTESTPYDAYQPHRSNPTSLRSIPLPVQPISQPLGRVFAPGEAPVIPVPQAPKAPEEEQVRGSFARLLASPPTSTRRASAGTYHIELPRDGLERRQDGSFQLTMPTGEDESTSSTIANMRNIGEGTGSSSSIRPDGPSVLRHNTVPPAGRRSPGGPTNQGLGLSHQATNQRSAILASGPNTPGEDGPAPAYEEPTFEDPPYAEPSFVAGDDDKAADMGRRVSISSDDDDAAPNRPVTVRRVSHRALGRSATITQHLQRPSRSLRSSDNDENDEELYRLSMQETPVEMTKRQQSFAKGSRSNDVGRVEAQTQAHTRTKSRDERRREIELASLSKRVP